jgi:PadR family transcriptional regulator PadR
VSRPPHQYSTNLIRGHLDLILLSILHKGPSHGTAICDEAYSGAERYFDLQGGSVYPALNRLEKAGFIKGKEKELINQGKPVRIKEYTLTSEGDHELDVQRRAFLLFSKRIASWWDPE